MQENTPICPVIKFQKNATFHDFTSAGAAWVFAHGVTIQDTHLQGTWSSDCVWIYIYSSPSINSPISTAFQAHLFLRLPYLLLGAWVAFFVVFDLNFNQVLLSGQSLNNLVV